MRKTKGGGRRPCAVGRANQQSLGAGHPESVVCIHKQVSYPVRQKNRITQLFGRPNTSLRISVKSTPESRHPHTTTGIFCETVNMVTTEFVSAVTRMKMFYINTLLQLATMIQ